MSRKASYEDCLNFIENHLKIRLLDFQKELLKCIFENKEVRTARGCGRKMVADAYGKYIGHLHAKNDYSVEPNVIIPSSTSCLVDGRGYYAKSFLIDEEPVVEFKNGSWIKIKE